jgi:hypothetical protein
MTAETDDQIRERLHQVLGLPPGTHRATYKVSEVCRLENQALSTGYLKIQRGEVPVTPNAGKARGKRIPAKWVIDRHRSAYAAEGSPEPAPPPGISVAAPTPSIAPLAAQAASPPAVPAAPSESPVRETLRQMLRQELGALFTAPSG